MSPDRKGHYPRRGATERKRAEASELCAQTLGQNSLSREIVVNPSLKGEPDVRLSRER